MNFEIFYTDELDISAAKLKSLDSVAVRKPAVAAKPHKDVNTFFNNQLKFATSMAAAPRDKNCNELKEKTDFHAKQSMWNEVLEYGRKITTSVVTICWKFFYLTSRDYKNLYFLT